MIKNKRISLLHKANSMTWAQRLKRVFAIEIEKGENCGGNGEAAPRKIARLRGKARAGCLVERRVNVT